MRGKWGVGRSDDLFAHPNSPYSLRYSPGLLSSPAPTIPSTALVTELAAITRAREVAPAGRAAGDPSIALRNVTVGYPDNEGEPIGVLAWVVVWFDSPPDVKGPRQPPGKKAAIVASQFCVLVVVVDAISGDALDVRQLCRRRTAQEYR